MFNIPDLLDNFISACACMFELLGMIMAPFFKSIIFCILLVALWVPIAMLQGYTLMLLWSWFVAPQGIHELTLTYAIGITLIVNLLTSHFTNVASEKDAFSLCGFWLLYQGLILCAAYIIKSGLSVLT
jgi:hypothetical protein